LQLILGFFAFDFMAVPRVPLQVVLAGDEPMVATGVETARARGYIG
jgi:hypothetical protein